MPDRETFVVAFGEDSSPAVAVVEFANAFCDRWFDIQDESMDGDKTEKLSEVFLEVLNDRMGNE